MSAAGRGAPRIENDNYPTPAWATRRILQALIFGHRAPLSHVVRVLEPCAGEGAVVRVVQSMLPNAQIVGGDIRGVLDVAGCISYCWDATRQLGLNGPFDLLITNPPFELAHDIIQAQRDTARLCCYLLRASFLEGERAESYRHDMPDEYKLPQRPNFIASEKCKGRKASKVSGGIEILPCGWAEKVPIGTPRRVWCPVCLGSVQRSESDASAYSWFVWTPVRKSVGSTVILPSTPLEERKAAA